MEYNTQIHEETLKTLLLVSHERLHLMQQLKQIRNQKYKTAGRNLILLDPDEKKLMQKAAVKKSDLKCSRMYEELNKKRIKADVPVLLDPYSEERK